MAEQNKISGLNLIKLLAAYLGNKLSQVSGAQFYKIDPWSIKQAADFSDQAFCRKKVVKINWVEKASVLFTVSEK
jgi:hypothetical protein